ncbi:MAG: hypothetical protein KKC11_07750, partial [Candidatus Omnitrophica bacterium]|nr:hypothetical protein [Candidatus Omnitrophota bacterium]
MTEFQEQFSSPLTQKNFPATAKEIDLPEVAFKVKVGLERGDNLSLTFPQDARSLTPQERDNVEAGLLYGLRENLTEDKGKFLDWLGGTREKEMVLAIHGRKWPVSDVDIRQNMMYLSWRAARGPPLQNQRYGEDLGLSLRIKFYHELRHLIHLQELEATNQQWTVDNLKSHPQILKAHLRIISPEVKNGITAKPNWLYILTCIKENQIEEELKKTIRVSIRKQDAVKQDKIFAQQAAVSSCGSTSLEGRNDFRWTKITGCLGSLFALFVSMLQELKEWLSLSKKTTWALLGILSITSGLFIIYLFHSKLISLCSSQKFLFVSIIFYLLQEFITVSLPELTQVIFGDSQSLIEVSCWYGLFVYFAISMNNVAVEKTMSGVITPDRRRRSPYNRFQLNAKPENCSSALNKTFPQLTRFIKFDNELNTCYHIQFSLIPSRKFTTYLMKNQAESNKKSKTFSATTKEIDLPQRVFIGGFNFGSVRELVNQQELSDKERKELYELIDRDYPPLKYELVEDVAPGFLNPVIERRLREIKQSKWMNGKPVVNYKSDFESTFLIDSQGREYELVDMSQRQEYTGKTLDKAREIISQGVETFNSHHSHCIFCSGLSKQILFEVIIEGESYYVVANINPWGKEFLLLVSKFAFPQIITEERLRHILIFQKALGLSWETIFNTIGASVYHFHAQFFQPRLSIWKNIEQEKARIENGWLSGWPSKTEVFLRENAEEAAKKTWESLGQLNIFYGFDLIYDSQFELLLHHIANPIAIVDEFGVVGATLMSGHLPISDAEKIKVFRQDTNKAANLFAQKLEQASSSPVSSSPITSREFRHNILGKWINQAAADVNRPLYNHLKSLFKLEAGMSFQASLELKEKVVSLEEDVQQLMDVINADKEYSSLIREGKAFKVEDIPELEEYRIKVKNLLREGKIVFVDLSGGMATRLGLGSMYPIDIVEVAKYILTHSTTALTSGEKNNVDEALGKFLLPEEERIREKLSSQAIESLIKERKSSYTAGLWPVYEQYREFFQQRTMGQRNNMSFQAAYTNLFSQEALKKVHKIVLPNSLIKEDVIENYHRKGLYGLKEGNLFFLDAPRLRPYNFVYSEGKIIVAENEDIPEEKYATPNHAYVILQMSFKNEGYTITEQGTKPINQPLLKLLEENEVELVVTRRINDLELWNTAKEEKDYEEVLGINQLAATFYLMDKGVEMVSEVLVNPGTQKGGLLLWRPGMDGDDSYLFEGLSGKTQNWKQQIKKANEQVAQETKGKRGGVFYNRFNQGISVKAAVEKIVNVPAEELNLPVRVRMRPGGLQLETPLGDFSYLLAHRGIYRQGATVKDFKAFNNLPLAL